MVVDEICRDAIFSQLNTDLQGKIKIDVEKCVESTNDSVKLMAKNDGEEGYLLIAEKQTKGKGRLGRVFFSPENTGIYMSLLLKPRCSPSDAVLITTAAAVSVCVALEKIGVSDASIKWVNDIFVSGRKVCGILTEAGFNGTNNSLDYVVLGVGINLYAPQDSFPDEIKNIAGAVFAENEKNAKNTFVAAFLNSFFEFYNILYSRSYVSLYKERCNVLGKDINVIFDDKSTPAKALDIDENCGLVVQYENGRIETLGSGEISVRHIGQLNQ